MKTYTIEYLEGDEFSLSYSNDDKTIKVSHSAIFEKFDMERKLNKVMESFPDSSITLEGVVIGPGVSDNRYSRLEDDAWIHAIYMDGNRLPVGSALAVCEVYGFRHAPVVAEKDGDEAYPSKGPSKIPGCKKSRVGVRILQSRLNAEEEVIF